MKAIIYPTQRSSESRATVTVISGEIPFSVPAVLSPILVNRSAGKALGLNSLLSPPSPFILVLFRLFFIPHLRAFLQAIISMMSLKKTQNYKIDRNVFVVTEK